MKYNICDLRETFLILKYVSFDVVYSVVAHALIGILVTGLVTAVREFSFYPYAGLF